MSKLVSAAEIFRSLLEQNDLYQTSSYGDAISSLSIRLLLALRFFSFDLPEEDI